MLEIRFGEEKDIKEVNKIRKYVNDLHCINEPDYFKPGFCEDLQNHVKDFVKSEANKLLIAEFNHNVCGYLMLSFINKQESAYAKSRKFVEISEIGVNKNIQGSGIGKALIQKAEEIALLNGYNIIEFNAWSFNKKAIDIYEHLNYEIYRCYFRKKLK